MRSLTNQQQIALDVIMRLMAGFGIGYFAWQTWLVFSMTHKRTVLFLFIAEAFTVALVLLAKRTNTRDFSLISVLLTITATFYFFLIYLDKGITLIPEQLAEVLMIIGISIQFISKIYLGRSFGLLPARRTIVTTGPYRFVRHPIYFGYFITHMSFLFSVFSLHNLVVYIGLYLAQFGRMYYEEKKLSEVKEYQVYKRRVKYRFIPFIL